MLKKRFHALIFVILIYTVNALVQVNSFPTENVSNQIFSVEYQDVVINDLPGEPQNWTWAASQYWCSGFGSFADPYVIEDLVIDAQET